MCLAALRLLIGSAEVHATILYSPGDLLIGFTTAAGTDEIYDLGKELSLTNGETWNLASLLTAYGNYKTVNWGVIGNGTNSGSPRTAWTTTAVGSVPTTIIGNGAFGKLNICAQNLGQNGPGGSIVAGESASVLASAPSSWNTITLNGTLATDYINAYENPNVVGVTSADFSQVLNDGSSPTLLGRFSLAANGMVTFNTVSNTAAVPTAGFSGTPTSGTAPLEVVFTDASIGSISNWLWTFGDGHSITNTSNANVTNTYAAVGSYTVSLTVTGPGGSNALTKTGYIVTSSPSAPKISNVTFSNGKLVISGTNGTASSLYRILASTNLASGTWTPIFTNNFLSTGGFAYTNSVLTSGAAYFRLVTP